MRAPLLFGTIALVSTLGCAHGSADADATSDLRGSILVAHGARLVVAGPASQVHTSVNEGRPVSLFLVDAVRGDDRDCAVVATRKTRLASASASSQPVVPEGRELCAAATGSTEVLWHAHADATPKALAWQ